MDSLLHITFYILPFIYYSIDIHPLQYKSFPTPQFRPQSEYQLSPFAYPHFSLDKSLSLHLFDLRLHSPLCHASALSHSNQSHLSNPFQNQETQFQGEGTTHKLKPSPGPPLWHFHGPENPFNMPQCNSTPLPEFHTPDFHSLNILYQ